MNVPEHLGCAQCGKPLSWHNSFGLTVPLDQSKVRWRRSEGLSHEQDRGKADCVG